MFLPAESVPDLVRRNINTRQLLLHIARASLHTLLEQYLRIMTASIYLTYVKTTAVDQMTVYNYVYTDIC
jgi:hypothetical protein